MKDNIIKFPIKENNAYYARARENELRALEWVKKILALAKKK